MDVVSGFVLFLLGAVLMWFLLMLFDRLGW